MDEDHGPLIDEALAILARPDLTAWVMTAGATPYGVPIPITSVGEQLLVVAPVGSLTHKYLMADERVRLGIGDFTRALLVDAVVTDGHPWEEFEQLHPEVFVARGAVQQPMPSAPYGHLLQMRRVRIWRGDADQNAQTTLMQEGSWLDPSRHDDH